MIKDAKRIVFKFGTNILRDENGDMAYKRIENFIDDISKLAQSGKEVIIVSSGAVGLGMRKLNFCECHTLIEKQACASVGQPYVMRMWERGFIKHNITVAQILLTEEDFGNRKKYLNLRNTLFKLLEHKIIPIINQNDTVSPSELGTACFSDNDKLSALVASKLDADLLFIISDINGLYNKNPKEHDDAKLMHIVKEITPDIEKLATGATKGGRGGMITKLQGAKVVTNSGAVAIIANGLCENIISKTFESENSSGTTFLPTQTMSSKKRWLAYATNVTGKVWVNKGAKEALIKHKTSLLPIGVIKIEGNFKEHDVLSILDEKGKEFARGITVYSAKNFKKILGKHSDEIKDILGYKISDDAISKDNLVIL